MTGCFPSFNFRTTPREPSTATPPASGHRTDEPASSAPGPTSIRRQLQTLFTSAPQRLLKKGGKRSTRLEASDTPLSPSPNTPPLRQARLPVPPDASSSKRSTKKIRQSDTMAANVHQAASSAGTTDNAAHPAPDPAPSLSRLETLPIEILQQIFDKDTDPKTLTAASAASRSLYRVLAPQLKEAKKEAKKQEKLAKQKVEKLMYEDIPRAWDLDAFNHVLKDITEQLPVHHQSKPLAELGRFIRLRLPSADVPAASEAWLRVAEHVPAPRSRLLDATVHAVRTDPLGRNRTGDFISHPWYLVELLRKAR